MGLEFFCSPELFTMPSKRKARSCQKGQTRTHPRKAARSAGPVEGSAPGGDGERRQRATRRGRQPPAARSPPLFASAPRARGRPRRAARAEPPPKRVCRRPGSPPARRSSSSDSSATLREAKHLLEATPLSDARPPADTPPPPPEDGGGTDRPPTPPAEGESRVADSDSSVASDLQANDVANQHELQDEDPTKEEPATALVDPTELESGDANDVSMSSDNNEDVGVSLNVSEDEAIADHVIDSANEPNELVVQIVEAPISDVNGNVISSSLVHTVESTESSAAVSVESTKSDQVLQIASTRSSGFIPTPCESGENVPEGSAVTKVESQDSVTQASEIDLLASQKSPDQEQLPSALSKADSSPDITFVDLTDEKDVYGFSNENHEEQKNVILEPDRSTTSFDSVELQVSSSDLINTKKKDSMLDDADVDSSMVLDDFVSYESFQQNNLRKCSSVIDMTYQDETIKEDPSNQTVINEARLEEEPLDLSTENSKTHCHDSAWQVKRSADNRNTRHVNLQTLTLESRELPIFTCAPKLVTSKKGESSSSKCVVPTWAMPIFQPFPEDDTVEVTRIEDVETQRHREPNNHRPSPGNGAVPASAVAASVHRQPADDEDRSESSDYSAFLKLAENMLDWSYGEDGQPPPLEALQAVAEAAFDTHGRTPAATRAPNSPNSPYSPNSPTSPNSLSSDDSFHSALSAWEESIAGNNAVFQEQPGPFLHVQRGAGAGRAPKGGGAGSQAEGGAEAEAEAKAVAEASRRASEVRVQFRPEVMYARYTDDNRTSRLSLEVHPRKLLRNLDALRSSARASDRRLAARVRAAERERRAEQRRLQRARERAEREWRLRVRRGLLPSSPPPPPPQPQPQPPPAPSHSHAPQPPCAPPPPPAQPVAVAAYLQPHAHAAPPPRSRPRVNAHRRRRRVSFSPWVTERGPVAGDARRASGAQRPAPDAAHQPP